MTTLYVMLGLPGSGKSYTALQLARRENAEIYSSDSFRLQMHLNAENAKQNNDLFDLMYQKIREELDADITVGDKIVTVNLDYTDFYLSMDCFWASLNEGEQLKLLEHEAARWLSCDELDSVEWLPADVKVVEAIRKALAE